MRQLHRTNQETDGTRSAEHGCTVDRDAPYRSRMMASVRDSPDVVVPLSKRDYSITGPERASAEAHGLVSADWYRSPVPRSLLKELVVKRNFPAARDTAAWLALLLVSGYIAHRTYGTWWALPAFAFYGTMYGSVSDARWHECSHRTAFKSQRTNDIIYNVASFMAFREPVSWRWSHARHHTDTIIVGSDPEIAVPRPTSLLVILSECFCMRSAPGEMRKIARGCVGRVGAQEADYVPRDEFPKVIWSSRVFVAIWVGVIGLSVATKSIEPLLLVGLPSFYGRWLLVLFGLTQHAGLAEDVLDHRMNTRTITMGPILRFLYWNMNFHIEHHMFPTVPYHALPRLHDLVKDDMPPVYDGLRGAYREIIPALRRQAKDPTYFVPRILPTATVEPAQ